LSDIARCRRRGARIHSRRQHRSIGDVQAGTVLPRRLRCRFCGTTWMVRVPGVGPGRTRSDRLRGPGVFLYLLGLSYRGVGRGRRPQQLGRLKKSRNRWERYGQQAVLTQTRCMTILMGYANFGFWVQEGGFSV
jgi:hypothetical protein